MKQNNGLKRRIILFGMKKLDLRKKNMIKDLICNFQTQLKKNEESDLPIILGLLIGVVRIFLKNM